MTIKELREKLQSMEKEGLGDVPIVVLDGNNKRIIVERIDVCGSGIHSSCEYAIINRRTHEKPKEYVPTWAEETK